jgi:hypothetical protein
MSEMPISAETDVPGQDSGELEGWTLTDEDIRALAERVYRLMKEDLRIERERSGGFRRRFG